MNTKHTPTPYFAEQDAVFSRERMHGDYAHRVASCGSVHGDPMNYADAAFIVRACNAHDDLVKALRNTAEALAHCMGDNYAIVIEARAALAKAGEA